MAKLIELKGISKSYDGEKVIDGMNLYIRDGEFITFLGPSGCGKTTHFELSAVLRPLMRASFISTVKK